MERIQAAIAKARATREATRSEAPARPAPSDTPSGTADVIESTPMPEASPGPAPEPAPAADIPAADIPGTEAPAPALSPEDTWAEMPVLKVRPRTLIRRRITALEGGSGTKEIDQLRTRILQQMRARGWKRLAITSPSPGCGKTYLAVNLGFSLARQTDQRAVVGELDLRRPTMAKLLGITDRASFGRVLAGEAVVEDCAVRASRNLAFLTNASSTRNSAELLQSARAKRVLDEIEARLAPTITLFDLPPMQQGDDALAFAERVDCMLIVAAAGQTTVREIDVCERDLAAQTNVLGVVLNKCRYMPAESGYGSYGGYD